MRRLPCIYSEMGPAYILELRGESLVLLGELRDQETLLPLGGPGVDLGLLQEAAEARDVALQLRHLQLVLLLHTLQPPTQVVLLLLQLLQHGVITGYMTQSMCTDTSQHAKYHP